MNDDLRQKWKRHALRWLSLIAERLREDAPDTITAHAIVCFFRLAAGFLGDSIMGEFGRQFTADMRQRIGLCQMCDGQIPAESCHAPVCAKCDAALKEEFDAVDAAHLDQLDKQVRGALAENGREMTIDEVREQRRQILDKLRKGLADRGFAAPDDDLGLLDLLTDAKREQEDANGG